MKKLILLTAFLVLLPYIIITYFYSENENKIMVNLKTNNSIIVIPLEEYVVGVVASEMPASFHEEALKAQAVAARTYVLKKINDNKSYDVLDTTSDQVYLNNVQLKEKWKNNYKKYLKKIKKVVNETKNELLVYNGEIIDAFFFSTSSGYTENSEEVFKEARPYLKSVSSPWDTISPLYTEKYFFTKSSFCEKLAIECNDLDINILEVTSTGRIKKIKINNKVFSGNTIKNKLKLRSSFFLIKLIDNEVYIETKGYGHGVGMSQYGAEALALKGYKYDEILKYYYQNVEIKKI